MDSDALQTHASSPVQLARRRRESCTTTSSFNAQVDLLIESKLIFSRARCSPTPNWPSTFGRSRSTIGTTLTWSTTTMRSELEICLSISKTFALLLYCKAYEKDCGAFAVLSGCRNVMAVSKASTQILSVSQICRASSRFTRISFIWLLSRYPPRLLKHFLV